MSENGFKTKIGEFIALKEINLIISNLLNEVIDTSIPYIWIPTEEPFYNVYKDKISYDHSGEVIKMTKKHLDHLIVYAVENPFVSCASELDELISSTYINSWEPSFESNRGKNWITYKQLLEEAYNEWKYDNFLLYDEEENVEFDELDWALAEVLHDFIKNTPYDIYFARLKRDLNDIG